VGLYEDGQPGEIFLVMAKEGSTISGFADAFAQAVSYALQYGVPLQVLVDKFTHVRFRAVGDDKNPRGALRQVDRRLRVPVDGAKFSRRTPSTAPASHGGTARRAGADGGADADRRPRAAPSATVAGPAPKPAAPPEFAAIQNQEDAPPCPTCGSIMVRSGACYKCANCGTTSGCA